MSGRRDVRMWAGGNDALMGAIGFFDISGGVELHHKLGAEQMRVVLAVYLARGRALSEELGSFVVKTIGDSLLVVFRTSIHAYDYGLQLRADPGDKRIAIHAGINSGQLLINAEGNDINGDAVNYASRLEGVAKRGEIVVSNGVKSHIDDERAERHTEYKARWISRFLNLKSYGRRKVWILPHLE